MPVVCIKARLSLLCRLKAAFRVCEQWGNYTRARPPLGTITALLEVINYGPAGRTRARWHLRSEERLTISTWEFRSGLTSGYSIGIVQSCRAHDLTAMMFLTRRIPSFLVAFTLLGL